MPNIYYTSISTANYCNLAERIKKLKPEFCVLPFPQTMENFYNSTNPEEIFEVHKRVLDYKLPHNFKPIFVAAKDIRAKIICVDDDKFYDNSCDTLQKMILTPMAELYLNSRLRKLIKNILDKDSKLLVDMNPKDIITRARAKEGLIKHYIDMYIIKELEREKHMAKNLKSIDGEFIGCFKDINFTMSSHLPDIPAQCIGNIIIYPLDKYVLLEKYKRLNLDIKDLRSDSPYRDCDPDLDYFKLTMEWMDYRARSNKLDLPFLMELKNFYNLSSKEKAERIWASQ